MRKPKYTASFRTHGGHVYGRVDFDAKSDAAAIVKTEAMYVPTIGNGYDLRDGERVVFSVTQLAH
jgi:hypothetical protein